MPQQLAAILLTATCATLGAAPADQTPTDKPDGFWRDCGGLRLGIGAATYQAG